MAREKRWEPFGPVALTLDGGVDGKITIPNTCGLHTKQILIFKSTTVQSVQLLEVKKVVSPTEFLVGPKGGKIDNYQDMSAFTVADGAVVWTQDQDRPNIPPHEFSRAAFEEEPTVAWRSVLVDKLGDIFTVDNPFPVFDQSSAAQTTVPGVQIIDVATADTEVEFTIPANTKRYIIKDREGNTEIRFSYIQNGTNDNGNYTLLDYGVALQESGVTPQSSQKIYLRTDKDNREIEFLYWT